MAHIHEVVDQDTHFIIDPDTRVISNAENEVITLMQFDHNSERLTFEIPIEVDGHDMSQCNKVQVHYINIGSSGERTPGVYDVDDIHVDPKDPKLVVCSWLVHGHATKLVGSLNFVVRFSCVTGETIDYSWNTAIYSGVLISSGIDNGELVVEEYSDVLNQWYNDLMNAGGEGINVVENYVNTTAKQTIDNYVNESALPAIQGEADSAIGRVEVATREHIELIQAETSSSYDTITTIAAEAAAEISFNSTDAAMAISDAAEKAKQEIQNHGDDTYLKKTDAESTYLKRPAPHPAATIIPNITKDNIDAFERVSTMAIGNFVVRRNSDGNVELPTTGPVNPDDAISKRIADGAYLSKTDANNTYLSKSDAGNTYLSKTDANNTYLSKSDAETDYVKSGEIIPISKGGTGATDAETARANLGINDDNYVKKNTDARLKSIGITTNPNATSAPTITNTGSRLIVQQRIGEGKGYERFLFPTPNNLDTNTLDYDILTSKQYNLTEGTEIAFDNLSMGHVQSSSWVNENGSFYAITVCIPAGYYDASGLYYGDEVKMISCPLMYCPANATVIGPAFMIPGVPLSPTKVKQYLFYIQLTTSLDDGNGSVSATLYKYNPDEHKYSRVLGPAGATDSALAMSIRRFGAI